MPRDSNRLSDGERPESTYVRTAGLSVLYARMPAVLVANLINSLLIAVIFQNVVPPHVLGVWLGLSSLLVVVRLAFQFRLRNHEKKNWADECHLVSIIGSYLSGLLWGAAGVLFFVSDSPIHLAALVFVLGGMAAGSLTTLYAHPLAFNGYLLLSLLPFCIRLFIEGEHDHWMMAGMGLLFILSLLAIGRQTHKDLIRRFAVQFENRELIDSLERRVDERTQRHASVVEFSVRALSGLDTDTLLHEAVSIVASGLPASLALASEWLPQKEVLSVRAVSGGQDRLLGQIVQASGVESPGGYALVRAEPTVCTDPDHEDRFAIPAIQREFGITGTISVPILGQGSPFGVLEAWNVTGNEISSDDINFVRSVATTISAALHRRVSEDVLQKLALYDTLTGLPNRNLFQSHLRNALNQASRNGDLLAILLIDLDEFKDINDTMGHSVGDQLLIHVARRLRACTRKSDPPARLGGDEFAVVLTGLKSPDSPASVADKIVSTLGQPLRLAGEDVHIGASVGITIYPIDGVDSDQLLRNADLALYRAKAGGRRAYTYYSPAMAQEVENRIDLLRELRGAIKANELELEYQPQIELTTGTIKGAEALLRWQNPRLGRILPNAFIPVAESSGIIASLGDWTMRHACRQRREWSQFGLPNIKVAVNVSLGQWRRLSAAEITNKVLRACDSAPQFLELEITERAFPLNDQEHLLACLGFLRQEGISIAIDDFGTGHSNLARLQKLPIDKIKIDRSFISGLGNDHNAETIVRSIIYLCRNLGIKVIAEGVEQKEQLDFLCVEGCDLAQGYLLGFPIDAENFSMSTTEKCDQVQLPDRLGLR